MDNRLVCLEGMLYFDEEVRTQTINIVSFRTGQQITVNRDRLLPGRTFAEHISQQISNAEKIFNQFNFVKMDEMNEGNLFADTIQVIYTFLSGPGAGKRVWQVTYACLFSKDELINFTSIYPDEASMQNEISRLQHCARHFILNHNL
ncbi:DcrB-related protein [Rahnella victoriana]|jgi:hypothetical protein|uniref:DcrB-related protein n=1 Tax=Rahnella victoriana TaxID=1510570 RepID=A0ABS0DSI4_9GAMM|nr:DcrB-related protein [Rahnella victoriana]MBF7956838.1 DcrB-related protein [Rahnella victoriana]PBI80238.1 hypothetical protein A9993_11070 [Rahnella victoriana]TBX36676.1 DUF1795 domain-containing protein [Rahnella victoriana]VTQ58564.1 Uncharacterized conserved protein [Campylobacter jejuni]